MRMFPRLDLCDRGALEYFVRQRTFRGNHSVAQELLSNTVSGTARATGTNAKLNGIITSL
jgi:hypothetical protein